MAQAPYMQKGRTQLKNTAHGVQFVDVWAGIGTNAGAAEAFAAKYFPIGKLRPANDNVAAASGVLGARVSGTEVVQHSGKEAEFVLHVSYNELMPFRTAPSTLDGIPVIIGAGPTTTVNLTGNILNAGMAGDVLMIGLNAYTINSVTDENTCVVATLATGEADGERCYVRSVTTGDLVEIQGSRKVAPGSITKTYIGMFASLGLHEDTADLSACPFCVEAGDAAAKQQGPSRVIEDWAQGRHLYTMQYLGWNVTLTAEGTARYPLRSSTWTENGQRYRSAMFLLGAGSTAYADGGQDGADTTVAAPFKRCVARGPIDTDTYRGFTVQQVLFVGQVDGP